MAGEADAQESLNPTEFNTTGGRVQPPPPPQKKDFAFAALRLIEDLERQRDHLRNETSAQAQAGARQAAQIISLSIANARLEADHRHLTENLVSERLQHGFISILSVILTAIGGGLVSVWQDWHRWLFGSLLLIGCAFMIFNSWINLGREIYEHGIAGLCRNLWHGWKTRPSESQNRGDS